MKKTLSVCLLVVALAIPARLFAEENQVPPSQPTNVSEKLDKILEELDQIKAELQIIKIRASMR